MHVTSYFIESLVLCFSCGSDKEHHDNHGDPWNISTSCSMNDRSRMIIGKQIHWTDQEGGQCNDGPFEYDLEPIKEIIRLQFTRKGSEFAPPSPSVKPPIKDEQIDAEVAIIADHDDSQLAALKEKPNFWEEMQDWNLADLSHPFYIILDAKEISDVNWPHKLKQILQDVGDNFAPLPHNVVVFDWSKYLNSDHNVTIENGHMVAQAVQEAIKKLEIPLSIITVIGFGNSAHVAGFIGKEIQNANEGTLFKIIALNPAGNEYNDESDHNKLTKDDATIVLTIQTETTDNIGSIDVLVNDPKEIQPWCNENAQCAHESAAGLLLECIEQAPVSVTNDVTEEQLHGFPLEVTFRSFGVYHLHTDPDGHPVKYESHANNVIISSDQGDFTIGQLKEHPETLNEVEDWNDNDGKHFYLIIDAKETSDKEWPKKFKKLVSSNNNIILIADWSMYLAPDYNTVVENGHTVAKELDKIFKKATLPVANLTIIGYGVSAHVSGCVGKRVKAEGEMVHEILALNPTGHDFYNYTVEEDRLTKDDAEIVIALHTETHFLADLIGSSDILVNNPDEIQPWCDEDLHCAQDCVISILLEAVELGSVQVIKNDTEEPLLGFPFNVQEAVHGVYHLNTTGKGRLSNPTSFDAGETLVYIKGIKYTINELLEEPHVLSDVPDDKPLYVIITGGKHPDKHWPEQLEELIEKTEDSPTILIVDWSMYNDQGLDIGDQVAQKVTELFQATGVSVKKMTLIGYANSAHVCGFIGKAIKIQSDDHLHRIIALNPTKRDSHARIPDDEKLTENDAVVVMVLYTETASIGYCCEVGSIDVIVNEPSVGQVWCQGNAQCAHQSVIPIFLKSIEHAPVDVRKEDSWSPLFTFPLDVSVDDNGTYHLATTQDGDVVELHPSMWPKETYGRLKWPEINFSRFSNINVDNINLIGHGKGQGYEDLNLNLTSQQILTFFENNPWAEVFIIITEEPYRQWAVKMEQALLSARGSRYVIVADWSDYVYQSYVYTSAHALPVAEALSHFIKLNRLPYHSMEIIGYSTSAHIAGLIGSIVNPENKPNRVTGLDPYFFMWHNSTYKLSESSGNIVQVVHTNTRNYGILEPLGTYDIYGMGGDVQPGCTSDECSHSASIYYYIESISKYIEANEATLPGDIAEQTGNATIPFGYHLIPNSNSHARLFVIDVNFSAPHLGGIVKLVPKPDDEIQLHKMDINLIVHYPVEQEQHTVNVELIDRNPMICQSLSEFMNISSDTPVYFVIGGEYLDEQLSTAPLEEKLKDLDPSGAVVVIADWNLHKKLPYALTASRTKTIGTFLAKAVTEIGLPPGQIHIIGFSLGAHIAGFLAKDIKNVHSGLVKRISALDPSKELFEQSTVPETDRLSLEDANYVDVYHTNTLKYGFEQPIGDADFYVNDGKTQPGCASKQTADIDDDLCSHHRAVLVYAESVNTEIRAAKVKYHEGGKLTFTQTAKLADFGFVQKQEDSGAFYVHTRDTAPFLAKSSYNASQGQVENKVNEEKGDDDEEEEAATFTIPTQETETEAITSINIEPE